MLGTAVGDDGMKLVPKLGGDVAVDGKREDLTAAARKFAPEGVDAIFATVGGIRWSTASTP